MKDTLKQQLQELLGKKFKVESKPDELTITNLETKKQLCVWPSEADGTFLHELDLTGG